MHSTSILPNLPVHLLSVPTMNCPTCIADLRHILGMVPGVHQVDASLTNLTVTVHATPQVQVNDLIAIITEEGYPDVVLVDQRMPVATDTTNRQMAHANAEQAADSSTTIGKLQE